MTTFALVIPLAGIGGHGLSRLVLTDRAGDGGFEYDFVRHDGRAVVSMKHRVKFA